jgi:hypothetical protein
MSSALRLKLYWLLSRNSRIALQRSKKGWGRASSYQPQDRLVNRLSAETGWSWQKVQRELVRERKLILDNPTAVIYPDFD